LPTSPLQLDSLSSYLRYTQMGHSASLERTIFKEVSASFLHRGRSFTLCPSDKHTVNGGRLLDGIWVEALTDSPILTVSGDPLAEDNNVFVVQMLCDASSNREGPVVPVKRGHMKVSVTPSQVAMGVIAQVMVTALDADTNAPVIDQVLLNGVLVGTT
jgi:hypothetical protein